MRKTTFLTGALTILLGVMPVAPTLAQSLSLSPGAVLSDCTDCPEVVVIPPGTFTMGSDHMEPMRDDELRPEGPVRSITIAKPFAVGRYEVTKAQFETFINATGYDPTNACVTWGGRDPVEGVTWQDPRLGVEPRDTDPVVCVDWNDAKAYTQWLAERTGQPYRLPTEAEWEYVAKAGANTVWPWGEDPNQICEYGNVFDKSGLTEPRSQSNSNAAAEAADCDDGVMLVAEVGQYKPNAFGLYDTIGNVWEWVEDCSLMLYTDGPLDGSAYQSVATCEKRAVRSGSWRSRISRHRPTFRGRDPADLAYYIFGFRIARDLN